MKVALFGRGKTGSKVADICAEEGIECTVFHSENEPSIQKLAGHDVVISFVPGKIMLSYLEVLMGAGLPIISGATGVDYPESLDEQLKEKSLTWIQGHNFSLGMNIVKSLFDVLNKAPNLFTGEWSAQIHEVHHTKKLDAPSGTALRWGEWFGHEVEITSERTGDVVGDHAFTFKGPYETITLTHQALDRRLFASGALWAANLVLTKDLPKGFHWFEHIATTELKV